MCEGEFERGMSTPTFRVDSRYATQTSASLWQLSRFHHRVIPASTNVNERLTKTVINSRSNDDPYLARTALV